MSYPAVARGPQANEVLLWVEARNRSTGDTEAMGLWTGPDDRNFDLGGDLRSYRGAGAVLEVPALVSQVGLAVQMQSAALAIVTEEVETLFRGYDARQAAVEVHLARFDVDSDALIGIDRVFSGWLDRAEILTGQRGGSASLSATLASSSRALTRRVAVKRSDEAQQKRSGDRFFRHADVSGAVTVWWGQKPGGGGSKRSQSFDDVIKKYSRV
ncbi:hypothetical protein KUW09_04875 [Mameliella alba]|nr:hypothetical protein [Antarctobacter heliothermus]MBY6143362.1 hypothetical protein [Mameliella alba]MCA0952913.1 hypothetical protein [Mameliella alba]